MHHRKRQRKLCGTLSTSASPRHHGRNGCFYPQPAVRENEDAHDKKCPHHHRRQKWLYSSSASLPPPFVENEDAQAILAPITITSAVR